jgi:hypothetical protein
MSALAFARVTQVKYLHSHFVEVDHAPGGANDWASSWERFFSLGFGEEDVGRETVAIEAFVANPRVGGGLRQVVVEARFYHPLLDKNPDLYCAISRDLKHKYASSDKSRLPLARLKE